MWSLLLSGASSFVSSYINYIKIGLIVLALCLSGYVGFHMGNSRYLTYKTEVEAVAEIQKAKVESIEAQHKLVTKGIHDEYDAKLALLRQYYANGVRQPSGSSVSGISGTAKSFDATTAYTVLAGQCAETTLQLVELQKWMVEQMGIK